MGEPRARCLTADMAKWSAKTIKSVWAALIVMALLTNRPLFSNTITVTNTSDPGAAPYGTRLQAIQPAIRSTSAPEAGSRYPAVRFPSGKIRQIADPDRPSRQSDEIIR